MVLRFHNYSLAVGGEEQRYEGRIRARARARARREQEGRIRSESPYGIGAGEKGEGKVGGGKTLGEHFC